MFCLQGFKRILYTPDEAAQVIASCEERLLKDKTIAEPFTAVKIQEGILKKYLVEEDYMAPHQVTNQLPYVCESQTFGKFCFRS